MQLRYTA